MTVAPVDYFDTTSVLAYTSMHYIRVMPVMQI